MTTPKIILTQGEPAGIGPDLCALIAQKKFDCCLTVVGDPDLLMARARLLGLDLSIHFERDRPHNPGSLSIWPVKFEPEPVCGELNVLHAGIVLKTLRIAVKACMEGDVDAMVTAPVHKGIINRAGIAFTGHTEYIADITGGHPVMMLATEGLRVALATTHLPLNRVSEAITPECLQTVLEALNKDLVRRFNIPKPRILVCGLNPHAGEGGYLGREEIEVIEPMLEKLRLQGMNLIGPMPADTLFLPQNLSNADAVLAMYHDQGLPVLKYKGFGNALNITLGLPIIRTSVDHGTALDLAGSGRIDSGSLETALHSAIEMVLNVKR